MWHHLCAIKLLLLRKKSLFETNQNQNCNNYNKQTHLASFSRGQNRQIRQNKLIGENRKLMEKRENKLGYIYTRKKDAIR